MLFTAELNSEKNIEKRYFNPNASTGVKKIAPEKRTKNC